MRGDTGVRQTIWHPDWALTGGCRAPWGCPRGFDLGREAVHLSRDPKFPRCQGGRKSGESVPRGGAGTTGRKTYARTRDCKDNRCLGPGVNREHSAWQAWAVRAAPFQVSARGLPSLSHHSQSCPEGVPIQKTQILRWPEARPSLPCGCRSPRWLCPAPLTIQPP